VIRANAISYNTALLALRAAGRVDQMLEVGGRSPLLSQVLYYVWAVAFRVLKAVALLLASFPARAVCVCHWLSVMAVPFACMQFCMQSCVATPVRVDMWRYATATLSQHAEASAPPGAPTTHASPPPHSALITLHASATCLITTSHPRNDRHVWLRDSGRRPRCVCARAPAQVLALMREEARAEARPSAVTYGTVVPACAAAGRWREAVELLDEAAAQGCDPG
jgi:pentatricopeptide repeat protein